MVSCHGYYNVSWRSSLNATKKDNEEFLFIPSTYILLWWINTDKKKKSLIHFRGVVLFLLFPLNFSLKLNVSPKKLHCPKATTLCLIWFLTAHNNDTHPLWADTMWNNIRILHVFLLTPCELSFGLHWHLSEISASLIAKCSTVLAG